MKSSLLKFGNLSLLLLAAIAGWFWYDMNRYMDTPMHVPPEGYVLDVQTGSHLTRILHQLSQEQILKKPIYLKIYARWHNLGDKIHVGEYQLTTAMTPLQLLNDLHEGKVIQYSITIVEGWTFNQLIQHIQENPYLKHTLKDDDPRTVMAALGDADMHPEGRFMADTYYYPRGLSDVDFLKRSYDAMTSYLAEKWPDRDVGLPVKTPYEALILASIVEKETGLASERRMIAGVFSRRLQKRMRLQSDPTVIYGMGEQYQGNIRRRDLNADNPYNTYQRFGLPPTPIALPGRDAIDAVLHPQDGDALYFVSKGDGSHYFSATLEQHNEAVIRYQLKGRKKPFSSYQTKE